MYKERVSLIIGHVGSLVIFLMSSALVSSIYMSGACILITLIPPGRARRWSSMRVMVLPHV